MPGAGGCCSCVVWMQRQDIPLAVPAVPDSPLTTRFVSLRRVEMVWSTRHQDSKLIDVCTGANPACARNAGEHLLLCFPVTSGVPDCSRREGQRAGGLNLPWPFGCAGRCRPCACCHMRQGRRPSALAHVRTACHISTQRCCCVCLLLHPRVPTVCCAGRLHDSRRCLLAANSVGFKQIKTCINTYKMHPAARLAYLREYANGNPYK